MDITPSAPISSFIPFSSEFMAEDANVFVRSSDGILFGLHRVNLEVVTGGFPFDSTHSTVPGVPDLPESAELLEKLFGTLYPDRPDLEFTDFRSFEDLVKFAESAAKYRIYPARGLSKEFLRRFVRSHSEELLPFAAQHQYHSLLQELAETELIDSPLSQIRAHIGDTELYSIWSEYKDRRTGALAQAQACSKRVHPEILCPTWRALAGDVVLELNRPSVLESRWDITNVFAPHKARASSDCCISALAAWEAEVGEIAIQLPRLSLK